MRQAKYTILKLSTLAIALAVTGGCVTAKVNMADEEAMAAPAPETKVAAPAPMMESKPTSYTVVSGDHLWGISEMGDIYGTPYHWPLLYKANANQIDDADTIFPGQNLDVPRNSSQSEIDAAVMHSKNRGAWNLFTVEPVDLMYRDG